jgi:hypothetical protein
MTTLKSKLIHATAALMVTGFYIASIETLFYAIDWHPIGIGWVTVMSCLFSTVIVRQK